MWDTKYRPLKYADVLGQPGAVQLLQSRLRNGSAYDTSYIFAGGHGQGKTTLARIHARAMLCQQLDKQNPEPCNQCDACLAILNEQPSAFTERDAASQGTVDHMRSIVEDLPFSVGDAPKRIYLFDEAHRMGTGAQDVLLKPIEDKKMVGMFCTTEPEKIKGTIRSRCEEHTIRKVTREDILGRMRTVLEKESVQFVEDAVLIVIDYSGGHVRDVLNKLEMIAQLGPVTVENVRDSLRLSVVSLYYEILLALGDPKRAVEMIEQACDRTSPEDVAAGIAEAAMNSFRLANGMHADFVYVDRSLALKVQERFGNGTLALAEHFLSARYVTRVRLLRDVLVLSQMPGNVPTEAATRPVVITVANTGTPAPSTSTPPSPSPPPAQTAAPPAAPTGTEVVASSGAIPPDPPLHSLDAKIAGTDMPRRVGHADRHFVYPEKNPEADERKDLHPHDWKREFERNWPGAGG